MNAIIKIQQGQDTIILKYTGVKKVYRQDLYLIVEYHEGYNIDKGKDILKQYNVSTIPFKHMFYNAKICGCYEEMN